ncbi:hypothetical protein BGZ60DRAFT_557829 [Tricladium varicosporioides]|nr:hypothetical protein BGZ60DRAFT_557829 [Hymenoscyphus varicosporioides]
MIFLLHREPGVGKTLTAENVADYTERPLYTVSSGDLGVDAAAVERTLLDALELAAHWNAIVLINPAKLIPLSAITASQSLKPSTRELPDESSRNLLTRFKNRA